MSLLHRRRFRPVALVLILLLATPARTVFPQASDPGSTWVVLIAVKKHDREQFDLDFTTNDAVQLRETLVQRGGVASDHILLLADDAGAAGPPTLKNLRERVPEFLARVGTNDRVIVFFSGHGVPFGDQAYLVCREYNPAKPAETALPAGELRVALKNCPAQSKFLILDCCHSGGTKEANEPGLPAEAVAKAVNLEEVTGCMVLASCRKNEKSIEWSKRQHGVFTYWLLRALEGGGDTNNDGCLTGDEIYRYTNERVKATAEQVFGRTQTPVRLIGEDWTDDAVLLKLRPEPPETLCRRLAEQLDLEISRKRENLKLNRVGVLEFLQPAGRAEGLAASNLPKICADLVRKTLAELAGDRYRVLDAEAMQHALRGATVEAVGDPQRMQEISERADGLDAIVTGTLRRRGTAMHLQCDLVAIQDGSSLTTPSGVLPLSEDLVGDAGGNFDNRQRPSGGPYETQVVSFVQTAQDHPLLVLDRLETPEIDESFPFRLEVWSIEPEPGQPITADTPRRKKDFVQLPPDPNDPQRRSTELLIPARENELFEIRVWSKFSEEVAMMLSLDGFNTLNKQRERLGRGAAWIVHPSKDWKGKSSLTIDGWYNLGQQPRVAGQVIDTTARRFKFVDIADSAAGRQYYTDSIGLITAAFYQRAGRDLAVGEGPEEQRQLKVVDFRPGRLIGVVNIRYVDEQDLERVLNR